MKKSLFLLAGLMALPLVAIAAGPQASNQAQVQAKRLTEADRKVTAGRILLKWGAYVEKVNGQNRRAWAAALWPSLANADLDNLQKASRAVTYEGMRNALLGQRPNDDQIIDRLARSNTKVGVKGNPVTKALGSLASDLVFTPITPCRIVDTRVPNDRIGAGATRDLDASNPGGNFTAQGGSNTNCGIPANPAALALSVTGLGNLGTGYLRVFPYDGTSAQGSPVPLTAVNTTATNDIIVPTCQGCTQELKVFSTANTHYAAFVTGYFMAPEATALQCVDVDDNSQSVGGNAVGQQISGNTCPAGYKLTSAQCWGSNPNVVAIGSAISGGNYYCRYTNLTAGVLAVHTYQNCCRVPGR